MGSVSISISGLSPDRVSAGATIGGDTATFSGDVLSVLDRLYNFAYETLHNEEEDEPQEPTEVEGHYLPDDDEIPF